MKPKKTVLLAGRLTKQRKALLRANSRRKANVRVAGINAARKSNVDWGNRVLTAKVKLPEDYDVHQHNRKVGRIARLSENLVIRRRQASAVALRDVRRRIPWRPKKIDL